MVAEPALMPVMIPEVSTVPTAVLLLLHVPPEVALLKVVVLPMFTEFVPVTVAGLA